MAHALPRFPVRLAVDPEDRPVVDPYLSDKADEVSVERQHEFSLSDVEFVSNVDLSAIIRQRVGNGQFVVLEKRFLGTIGFDQHGLNKSRRTIAAQMQQLHSRDVDIDLNVKQLSTQLRIEHDGQLGVVLHIGNGRALFALNPTQFVDRR